MEPRDTTIEDFGKIDEDRFNLINMVAGAYRSIRMPIAYVSMPITSGKLMYEILEKKGVKTIEELSKVDSDSLYKDIIAPNIKMGVHVADNIRTKLPPIAPSVFEGKSYRWNQLEYMALWFRVIEERAREMHMTDGWEYSNGGVEEFTRAIEMQFGFINPFWNNKNFPLEKTQAEAYDNMREIKIYDLNGDELKIDTGIQMVANAISDIHNRGFEYSRLEDSFDKLFNAAARCFQPDYCFWEKHPYTGKTIYLPYSFDRKIIYGAQKQIQLLQ